MRILIIPATNKNFIESCTHFSKTRKTHRYEYKKKETESAISQIASLDYTMKSTT